MRICSLFAKVFLGILISSGAFGQEPKSEVENLGKAIDDLQQAYYANQENLNHVEEEKLQGTTKAIVQLTDSIKRVNDTTSTDSSSSDQANNSINISTGGISIDIHQDDDSSEEDDEALDPVKFSFLNMDIGLNNYLSDGNFQMPNNFEYMEVRPGRSINFKLTFVKPGFSLINHHLSMLSGIGIDYNNYFYDANQIIAPDADQLTSQPKSEGYDKYKLTTQYLFAPLEFRYESNPGDHGSSFRMAAGGRVGYLIRSYTKLVENDGDKVKDFGDFNLRQYKVGLVGRVGYGRLNFYANYSLTPLFNDGAAPDFNPIAFGITLNGFKWD
jgi:hypothetical protein